VTTNRVAHILPLTERPAWKALTAMVDGVLRVKRKTSTRGDGRIGCLRIYRGSASRVGLGRLTNQFISSFTLVV
jgi:hypothetical protein